MYRARPLLAAAALAVAACDRDTVTTASGCDASIKLPDGFCATLVTDTAGRARHVAVRSNGDVFVARLASRRDSGGVTSIRGTTVMRFGRASHHGLALASDSTLYASTADAILRYRFRGDSLAPRATVDTIVMGLGGGAVPMHSIVLDHRGNIIVSIPARGSGCGQKQPCPDLATSGGIWRFETGKRNQTLQDGHRIATGLRNPIALAINPRDTMVYAVTHGPDSLAERYRMEPYAAASRPGDEMIRVASVRADYGWPYCYFDVIAGTRVQSPEYGGDGKVVGACDRTIRPLMAFPAHWEPMAMVFPGGDKSKLPAKYKDGVFVAFHGSSHRAPLPEAGYVVAFVPFKNGVPTMDFEVFADGFAGAMASPAGARARPSGLAQGPDGSLYVSDGKGGRVWRITYTGT